MLAAFALRITGFSDVLMRPDICRLISVSESRAYIEFRCQNRAIFTTVFNVIPVTNHNANPTNPNTRYRCEYGTIKSMFAHSSMNALIVAN